MSRNKSYTSLRSDSWTSVRTENTAREKSESLSGGKERDLRTEDRWVARPRFSIHTDTPALWPTDWLCKSELGS